MDSAQTNLSAAGLGLPDAALTPTARDCPVHEWVENFGHYVHSVPRLVEEVANRFADCGLPAHRVSVLLRTLHPQIAASGYVWSAETRRVSEYNRDHSTQTSEAYLRSPMRLINEGAPGLRRRLADPATPRDFPILDDLDADGITDYVVLPVPFSDGKAYAASWATRAPGGFTDDQLARIVRLMPLFSLVVEILAQRAVSKTLLATYLGRKTGERVLDGAIYRGVNETIDAVVWLSDLRRFTAMSDALAPAVMLGVLNDHFERVVGAIDGAGGEVLKFMGDSVLAIFPFGELGGARAAARAAIGAARAAVASMEGRNAEREAKGLGALGYGIALHMGPVVYGNIGSADRLDFTVIGPAVNQASRIEALCRTLARPVLVSGNVAEAAGDTLVSLGSHALRGVREPYEIFTLPEHA